MRGKTRGTDAKRWAWLFMWLDCHTDLKFHAYRFKIY